jgi:hypothetical protein
VATEEKKRAQNGCKRFQVLCSSFKAGKNDTERPEESTGNNPEKRQEKQGKPTKIATFSERLQSGKLNF